MKAYRTELPDVWMLEPHVFDDARGFFFESYHQASFNEDIGQNISFVQDNHSGSKKNVLRGLHYQVQLPQGKLVRVTAGSIYDVAVDVRPGSPTFGRYVGVTLSAENKRMLWIPAGFAHGFLAVSEWNEVIYKATDFYAPQYERSIRFDDPDIGIRWPLGNREPIVSDKDMSPAWLKNVQHESNIQLTTA